MAPIIKYLEDDGLPDSQLEAQRIKARSMRYLKEGDLLYKKGYKRPVVRCLTSEEEQRMLKDIHKGDCSGPFKGRVLAHEVLRQGYLWLTLQNDARSYTRKCIKCQTRVPMPKKSLEKLSLMASIWPFVQWG